MFIRQSVLADGACLFRAIAVSLFYNFTGKNIGGGCPLGMESTYYQTVHNILVKWIRWLCVAAMCSQGVGPTITTTLGANQSLFLVLLKANLLLSGKNEKQRPMAAEKSNIQRRLEPRTPSIKIGDGKKVFKAAEEEFLAEELSMGGAEENTTFRQHCSRMLDWTAWGGESEIFVMCTEVFRLPIVVYENGRIKYRYTPSTPTVPQHVLKVVYNGNNHFDALLETQKSLPPMLSEIVKKI